MQRVENICSRPERFGADEYLRNSQEDPAQQGWFVLWTHSNCEMSVHKQLTAKGYNLFLAMTDKWSSGSARKYKVRVPMFSSYVFINHAIDKYDYLDICNTKGVVTILGPRWDRLAQIPEPEIEMIRLAASNAASCAPYPYLKNGDKVRITRGALENLEGILVKTEAHKGLLVVSVDLLKRSVAVEVDCRHVVPA